MLWRKAARLARERGLFEESVVDAAEEKALEAQPAERIRRFRWQRGSWVEDVATVKAAPVPFAEGSMRVCFKAKTLSSFKNYASPEREETPKQGDFKKKAILTCSRRFYVLKTYKPNITGPRSIRQLLETDVITQSEAKELASAYNRRLTRLLAEGKFDRRYPKPMKYKCVDMLEPSLVVFPDRVGAPAFFMEAYVAGQFDKYNDNAGFVSGVVCPAPSSSSSQRKTCGTKTRDDFGGEEEDFDRDGDDPSTGTTVGGLLDDQHDDLYDDDIDDDKGYSSSLARRPPHTTRSSTHRRRGGGPFSASRKKIRTPGGGGGGGGPEKTASARTTTTTTTRPVHWRATPQAFSHFTFTETRGRRLVVDVQGVGDLFTDPQIHTDDGAGYGRGNGGLRGIALFFATHRCNRICRCMGLPSVFHLGCFLAASPDNTRDDDDDDDDDDASRLSSVAEASEKNFDAVVDPLRPLAKDPDGGRRVDAVDARDAGLLATLDAALCDFDVRLDASASRRAPSPARLGAALPAPVADALRAVLSAVSSADDGASSSATKLVFATTTTTRSTALARKVHRTLGFMLLDPADPNMPKVSPPAALFHLAAAALGGDRSAAAFLGDALVAAPTTESSPRLHDTDDDDDDDLDAVPRAKRARLFADRATRAAAFALLVVALHNITNLVGGRR